MNYQLIARFYRENPIVEIGLGAKFSPGKISSQYRALMKGDGPKQAIINAMKSLTQFLTAQEFHNLISNLCIEKELKVYKRIIFSTLNVIWCTRDIPTYSIPDRIVKIY